MHHQIVQCLLEVTLLVVVLIISYCQRWIDMVLQFSFIFLYKSYFFVHSLYTAQHRIIEFIGKIGCVRMLQKLHIISFFVKRITNTTVDGLDSWSRLQIIDSV